MITRIQVLNYRCLRYIDVALPRYVVLVGPNGSGKSTLLDALLFVGDIVRDGVESAVRARTNNPRDLLSNGAGEKIEFAIEAELPPEVRTGHSHIRYEIGLALGGEEPRIARERVSLVAKWTRPEGAFGDTYHPSGAVPAGLRIETYRDGKVRIESEPPNPWAYTAERRTGSHARNRKVVLLAPTPGRSALGWIPGDGSGFPGCMWLRESLTLHIAALHPDANVLRMESSSERSDSLRPDGGNVPWVVDALANGAPERFKEWIAHARTGIADLAGVQVWHRYGFRDKYLKLRFDGGAEVPSWMVSDGTLRLLALTLPAYLPNFSGVLMVEEPENGIHPRAIEAVIQSLSSVYSGQVFVATHSPLVLAQTRLEDLLCFSKGEDGGAVITPGTQHPLLQDWNHEPNLGVLLSSGVLG